MSVNACEEQVEIWFVETEANRKRERESEVHGMGRLCQYFKHDLYWALSFNACLPLPSSFYDVNYSLIIH